MNKKGLQFRNAFFAVIVISMVVFAMGSVINEWNGHYGSNIEYNLDKFNKGDEISTTVEGYEGKISPNDPETNTDYQSNTLQASYGVITNLLSPFRIVFGQNGMLDSIAEIAHVPAEYVRPIVTMMILSIVFAIIAIIFKTWRTTT